MGLSVMLTGQDCPYMACSIKAKPGLDLLMGHKPWIGSYKQQLKGYQAPYTVFIRLTALGAY